MKVLICSSGRLSRLHPRDLGCLLPVGLECAADDDRVEDGRDVGGPVSVRVDHPVLRTPEHAEHGAEADDDAGLFLRFANGTLLGRFVGLDGTADRRPEAGVGVFDEEDTPGLVAGKHRGRRQDQELVAHQFPQLPDVGRDRHHRTLQRCSSGDRNTGAPRGRKVVAQSTAE